MLGPIQIVLIGGSSVNWHLHVTAHTTIQSINEMTELLYHETRYWLIIGIYQKFMKTLIECTITDLMVHLEKQA